MQQRELPEKVSEIDRKIIELANQRASLIVAACSDPGYDAATALHRGDAELRQFAAQHNAGPLSGECVEAVCREIQAGCAEASQPMRASYLGPAGTFAHSAALRHVGAGAELVPTATVSGVFADVASGRSSCGIVPIENSTEGGISDTLQMFIDTDVKVCAEIILPIHHHLMASCELTDVRRVCSKAIALGQCRRWLSEHLPKAELLDVASTSAAAGLAKDETGTAAIAQEVAAEIYDLKILARSIEDNPRNFTRFFVLGQNFGPPTGHDKTSIMCSIKDQPGALWRLLTPFTELSLNMTKIESFPSQNRAWAYWFFIDVEGHCDDEGVKAAVERAREECTEMKILGSFPQG